MSVSDLPEFSLNALAARVAEARAFHAEFVRGAMVEHGALRAAVITPNAHKRVRRCGGAAAALIAQLGSNRFAKRRAGDTTPFLRYVEERAATRAPIELRVVVGPVKNVRRFGAEQEPDLAEYLMLMQLARLAAALAPFHTHGVRVQLVPDDLRGRVANLWPEAYGERYIAGLARLVETLGFAGWMRVENGQRALYGAYGVARYQDAARAAVLGDPVFETLLARACRHARENLVMDGALTDAAVRDSALRYLVAHKAENLSGMWSAGDALPLVYANHPGQYQLFTMGPGVTKLPWQVRLPFEVLGKELGLLAA